MFIAPNIKAVCFDAFGTLVEIADKRRPYKSLIEALDSEAAASLTDRVMREPLSLEDCIADFAPSMASERAHELQAELGYELASIVLRPHISELWAHLKRNGYRIAICSNLALPYGPALLNALPAKPDALILSFETGFIKPEPEIYQLVCDKLELNAENILFTGDTPLADVSGPKSFGMAAELIDSLIARFVES